MSRNLFLAEDSDEEPTEEQRNETNPGKMPIDFLLSNKQLEIFFEHFLMPHFEFTRNWLNKFEIVSNKNYNSICCNASLLRLFKKAVTRITQKVDKVLSKDKECASSILNVFSELEFRDSNPNYKKLRDDLNIDTLKVEVQSVIDQIRVNGAKRRKTEKNRKNKHKTQEEYTNGNHPQPPSKRSREEIEQDLEDLLANQNPGEWILEDNYYSELVLEQWFETDDIPENFRPSVYLYGIPITRESKVDPRLKNHLEVVGLKEVLKKPGIEKFQLILDLDKTLIHAVPEQEAAKLKFSLPSNVKQVCDRGYTHCVALRQGLAVFLEKVSRFCDIYVYTHGEYNYASCMINQIDPHKQYIKGFYAVRGSTDNTARKNFKILEKELRIKIDSSLAVVFDDQIDVWEDIQYTIASIPYSPLTENSMQSILLHPMMPNSKFNFRNGRFLSDEDSPQLISFSKALEAAYYSFIENQGKYTALYELACVRKKVLRGTKVSFKKYENMIEFNSKYTRQRLELFRVICEELGAEEQKAGIEVVEETPLENEGSTMWLENCYVHFKKTNTVK